MKRGEKNRKRVNPFSANFHYHKKGQVIGMSFELIFSLILIAAFIFAAFTGIKYFMATADNAKINLFISDLRSTVESAGRSQGISKPYDFYLPSRIKWVCFANENLMAEDFNEMECKTDCSEFISRYLVTFNGANMNMFFCPPKGAYSVNAPFQAMIDCKGNGCLEFPSQPYCIQNKDGKITITLEKESGQEKILLK